MNLSDNVKKLFNLPQFEVKVKQPMAMQDANRQIIGYTVQAEGKQFEDGARVIIQESVGSAEKKEVKEAVVKVVKSVEFFGIGKTAEEAQDAAVEKVALALIGGE